MSPDTVTLEVLLYTWVPKPEFPFPLSNTKWLLSAFESKCKSFEAASSNLI